MVPLNPTLSTLFLIFSLNISLIYIALTDNFDINKTQTWRGHCEHMDYYTSKLMDNNGHSLHFVIVICLYHVTY